ncbi:30S ribosomal protein S4 [Myxococcota bacterium]|nr:30S ribosomal protein S4 [Myxococcota bacterium]MBU1243106.1 30S ribosomal protein S4 [Myxococcota bacterium]MBU1412288.1 30S ribosomal protein S4 [Myxococcota bacterium]MBU1510252.1 30S ribosomal protein S4 [Myxococcota bacterium]PKN27681.1 MAG: 30S ribosomal protein S4 [Deltaproteobacteria bacterium HGW-Deltaproteobacteria-22]
MSRYIGPRVKKMRALGLDLPGLSRKTMQKRPFPPGQHGQRRRGRRSDYGTQLIEKQKLRYNYGLGERQLRRLMKEARRSKAATGDKLAELIERRLDNVLFRAGFAPTIPAARQLVNHSHFIVNGKKVNIPSFRVKVGDEISLRERSRELKVIEASIGQPQLSVPDWMEIDSTRRVARVRALPTPDSIPFEVDLQAVVEYYSKRM